ncbi:MAG TPA: aspartate kinase [Terriglobales bacterium]|nr:aspartate kinase [Terriglobales bacterium]
MAKMSQAAEKGRGSDARGSSCVVLKFGGTSVEDPAAFRRVLAIVGGRRGEPAVVVVSALARVTDQLLAAGEHAAAGRLVEAIEILRTIRERHDRIARELILAGQVTAFLSWVHEECEALAKLLQGVTALGEFSPRTADRVVGAGEVLSSRLLTEALRGAGNDAVWVNARDCIVTDDVHGSAVPLREETQHRLQRLVAPLLASGHLPVMGGFIAAALDGTPTTLGRGGSDFSAALVAAGLEARALEIWTDVDGIMTADPRLCPDARLIPTISFAEAAELAQAGAKVLHPATLLPATEKNIPVYVRNSRRPESHGTRIVPEGVQPAVRAITAKRGVVIVEARLRRQADAPTLGHILKACEGHNLDLCSVSRQNVVLLTDSRQAVRQLGRALQDVAEVHGENHKAIVRVFGDRIGRRTQLVEQIFRALSGIEVRLACPGESERNLTLVVDEDQAAESVRRLHNLFFPVTGEPEKHLSQAGVQ